MKKYGVFVLPLIFMLAVVLTGKPSNAQISPIGGGGDFVSKSANVLRLITDKAVPIMGVRNDADSVLATTDSSYTPISVSSTGHLKVDAAFSEVATAANGAAAPAVAKVAAGVDGGNLARYLLTSNAGRLSVDVNSSGPLIVTGNSAFQTNLVQVNGNTMSSGNGVAGTGVQRVTVASDNTPFTVNSQQIGSAYVTNLSLLNNNPLLAGNGTTGVGSPRVTIASDQTAFLVNNNQTQVNGVALLAGNGVSGTGSQRVNIASDNTPFTVNAQQLGASAFLTNLTQLNGNTLLSGNGVTGTGSPRVTIASDQTAFGVNLPGKTASDHWRNDYTGTSVTTAAYVQLSASSAGACTELQIFDSSGQTLVLATGAAASEVDKIYIFPGGNDRVPLAIPASTRISIKAVSATASVGEIDINCLN